MRRFFAIMDGLETIVFAMTMGALAFAGGLMIAIAVTR